MSALKIWDGATWQYVGVPAASIKATTTTTSSSAAFSSQTTLLTLPSINLDGSTEVEVEFSWYNFTHTVATDSFVCYLYDGDTLLSEWLQVLAANSGGGCLRWRGTPSAGAHVFTARSQRSSGTGTATLVAAVGVPAQLTVSPV